MYEKINIYITRNDSECHTELQFEPLLEIFSTRFFVVLSSLVFHSYTDIISTRVGENKTKKGKSIKKNKIKRKRIPLGFKCLYARTCSISPL